MKLDEEELWMVLIGVYVVITAWKIYLCLRTFTFLKRMLRPPPPLDGFISDAEFNHLKRVTQSDSYDKLLDQCVDLGIRIVKLASDYYPYVWHLTADYGKSPTSRAVWFAAIDRVIYEAAFIPVTFVHSLYLRRDPFLVVLNGLFDTATSAIKAAVWVYILVFFFELIHPSGIVVAMLLKEVTGVIGLALFIKFLESYVLRPLPQNEVGESITKLASSVGYPSSRIFVDDLTSDPEIIYYSAFWYNMITITPLLMAELDVNQLTGFVAHEIGKWYYAHAVYTNFLHFLRVFAHCYLLFVSYGNERISKIFRMDPQAHPIIPQILAIYYIWEPLYYDVARGIYGVFKSHWVLVRDDYACKIWKPQSLSEALAKMSRYPMSQFSLFDRWYASWFFATPPSLQRILRIQRKVGPGSPDNPPGGDSRTSESPTR